MCSWIGSDIEENELYQELLAIELKLVVIVPTGEIRGLAVASEKTKGTLHIEPFLLPCRTIAYKLRVVYCSCSLSETG